MKIGFLGLGIMGSRMAANLVKGGHTLVVWNRSAEKSTPLAALGAKVAATPAETARGNEVVITMLGDPRAVESVALGEQGFLAAMPPGALWMDSSTVNPAFTRQMAAEAARCQVRFIDAPVAGSKLPAENGQLLFMVGGEAADVEKVRPLTEKMGRGVIHVGAVGMGSALKLVNNMLVAAGVLAFSESLLLGESLGITRDRLFEVFSGPASGAVAPLSLSKRPKIESGNYDADFPLQWMQKDLELASYTAYENGLALPLANAAKAVFMLAARYGYGEEDMSAVYAFLKHSQE